MNEHSTTDSKKKLGRRQKALLGGAMALVLVGGGGTLLAQYADDDLRQLSGFSDVQERKQTVKSAPFVGVEIDGIHTPSGQATVSLDAIENISPGETRTETRNIRNPNSVPIVVSAAMPTSAASGLLAAHITVTADGTCAPEAEDGWAPPAPMVQILLAPGEDVDQPFNFTFDAGAGNETQGLEEEYSYQFIATQVSESHQLPVCS